MKKITTLATISVALALAGSAMAQSTLSFGAYGPYTLNGSALNAPNLTVVAFQTAGTLGLSTLTSGGFAATLTGGTIDQGFTGSGGFIDATNTNDFGFTLDTTGGSNNGGTIAVNGDWSYVSGTGTYANLTGNGTFAATFNPALGNYTITTFAGTLNQQAVPLPSAVIPFAIFAIALLAKRRQS